MQIETAGQVWNGFERFNQILRRHPRIQDRPAGSDPFLAYLADSVWFRERREPRFIACVAEGTAQVAQAVSLRLRGVYNRLRGVNSGRYTTWCATLYTPLP
jgi:hypothetical protein